MISAAQPMRRDGLAAIAVTLTTNRHMAEQPQYQTTRAVCLTIGTAEIGRLIRTALHGMRGIDRTGYRYKNGGIRLLALLQV